MISDILSLVVAVAVTGAVLYRYRHSRKGSIPLPPGPKKLPMFGNLLDMPSSYEWETFMQWARDFNTDILHLEVPGTSIIVLDTYEAAVDLLEKRSRYYSGRPNFPMAVDLMELDFNFALKPYGQEWRDRHRLMHGAMHPTAVGKYHTQELKATHTFLRAMLNAGEDDVEKELRHISKKDVAR
ncbi:cytochrome P450 [Schizophyllum commune]